MGAFLPNYLQTIHGAEVFESLIMNGIFLIISSLVRSILGPLTDKFGGDKCTIVGHFICAAGAAIFAMTADGNPYSWNIIVGILTLASAQGLLNSAVFKWNPKIFGNRAAQVGGVVGAIGALGGFFIPIILSLFGGGSKSVFFITGMHVFMSILCIILKIVEDNRVIVKTKS